MGAVHGRVEESLYTWPTIEQGDVQYAVVVVMDTGCQRTPGMEDAMNGHENAVGDKQP
jgi:hypothetical protein